MKGLVFRGDRRCELIERDAPEPGFGEVRVRIRASGVCGSDLSVYRAPFINDEIKGHEPSGEVEKVGPGVRHLAVGDRVGIHHHIGCGVCLWCVRGETVACAEDRCIGMAVPGSFGEYVVAPERNCVKLPERVSFVDGAFMACVGTTAFAALRRLGAMPHETLAVFGLGPVGLSCVILGKALGLRVIGMDVASHRLELALRCGAREAVDGREDVVAALQRFGDPGRNDHLRGVDYLIETSGSAPARRLMLPGIRRGGKIAILGVGSDEEVLNPSHIHGKAATIVGSVVFPIGWMWDLAKMLEVSGTSFEPAVTHRFTLDDGAEAIRVADAAEGGKVVIEG
ncbi:MAG: alcohol dehydrogenase catalytic domain-containing protein [Armatimonadetes bacterium]|nr:alcohol dehydrogenase catalytic domain-containing protein [Armatimonadota bacterium]